jgi:hypothetical protein
MSDDKPLNGRFTVIMHIVQLIVIVIGGVAVFFDLKSDVRSISEHVAMVQREVDKIIDYVGVWRPRTSRNNEP